MRIMKKQRAFTLAEVLVSVAIVGVISVLVIPTVVKRFQDEAFSHGLEKQKVNLEETLSALVVTENVDNFAETMMYVPAGTSEENIDYDNTSGRFMKKYLKVAKYCGTTNKTNCFANRYYRMVGKQRQQIDVDDDLLKGACATLKGGSSICMTPQIGTGANPADRIKAVVDINGPKGPNIEGRDLLAIEFDQASLRAGLNKTIDGTNGVTFSGHVITPPPEPDPPVPDPCNSNTVISEECCRKYVTAGLITGTSVLATSCKSYICADYPDLEVCQEDCSGVNRYSSKACCDQLYSAGTGWFNEYAKNKCCDAFSYSKFMCPRGDELEPPVGDREPDEGNKISWGISKQDNRTSPINKTFTTAGGKAHLVARVDIGRCTDCKRPNETYCPSHFNEYYLYDSKKGWYTSLNSQPICNYSGEMFGWKDPIQEWEYIAPRFYSSGGGSGTLANYNIVQCKIYVVTDEPKYAARANNKNFDFSDMGGLSYLTDYCCGEGTVDSGGNITITSQNNSCSVSDTDEIEPLGPQMSAP